ncbi:MAG: DUF4474 domain-containing protein [Clostridiales bacterium]|nr:DUF4474 domain-containing protein [Clostridiales bacterium]
MQNKNSVSVFVTRIVAALLVTVTILTTALIIPAMAASKKKTKDKTTTEVVTETETETTTQKSVKNHAFNIQYDDGDQRLYNKNGRGLLSIGFDYDKDQNVWYSAKYPWQREFGYRPLYDAAAPMVGLFYNTFMVKFDYEWESWCLQFWKGQYGYTSGAEMGIYVKPFFDMSSAYRCASDNDCLPMSMKVYRGGKPFFERSEAHHWWLTGFKFPCFTLIKDLKCLMTITFKTPEMRDLFLNGIEAQGWVLDKNVFYDGNTVSFIW